MSKRRHTYRGRTYKAAHKTYCGTPEKRELFNMGEIKRHCNEFFRSRQMPVGLVSLDLRSEGGDEP